MLELHEEEVGVGEMDLDNNFLHLMSSPGSSSWQIQQVWEPGLLYFDCPSLPATPMEELTLWTHSWSHHHHHESGVIKGAAKAEAFDAQLQEDDVAGGALPMNDWLYELILNAHLQTSNMFVVSSRLHLLLRALRKLLERANIVLRSEEKIFTAATSQLKINLKLIMETKSQNPFCDERVQVVDESSKVQCMQLDAKSPPEESTLHNLPSRGDCALLYSFQQRSITEHGNPNRKGDTGPSGQNIPIFEYGDVQKLIKKSNKQWGIGGSVTLADLKQQYGKKRKEAAESLNVSISTFKRICREQGISRWPSKKIKRDSLLLSNLSSNGTVPVAGGVQISISTTQTAFASTKVLVKSNQQKSRSSNLSLDNEIGTSLNDDVLRNVEGTDWQNIMIQEGDSADQEVLYKPQEIEPPCDSLIPAYPLPDAPTILSPFPQERMPAKDSPGQQGEETARQIEMADGTSQLEKQYLGRERLSCNTENEFIFSVEESSSYDFRNVSEPNQDHLSDFASLREVNIDQLISMDDLESNRIKAQSILESKSEPSLQNNARRMKLIFEKLITLPLEDLTNPNHEASMKEALTILAGNLSFFADEQAKQLLELKFDFPTITYSWRDCSQSRIDCRNFLAEFEKTKSLLETSTKEEEDLKDRYIQLESKEKEMMAQLEAIQKEKNEITKQWSENFNQTKHLAVLAEEQAGRTKEKELQMTIASSKLDKLKRQWVSVQSSFS